MAKLIAVAVFDAAVGSFNRPFFVPARGAALRSFGDEATREHPENSIWAHPGDYSLHVVGEFDEESGLLSGVSPPERLCNASDFRVSSENSV